MRQLNAVLDRGFWNPLYRPRGLSKSPISEHIAREQLQARIYSPDFVSAVGAALFLRWLTVIAEKVMVVGS